MNPMFPGPNPYPGPVHDDPGNAAELLRLRAEVACLRRVVEAATLALKSVRSFVLFQPGSEGVVINIDSTLAVMASPARPRAASPQEEKIHARG